MSDNVQLGGVNSRGLSKTALGRLRLSTACTECHKRKQRCDRRRPCQNCSRRYPQPECKYQHIPTLPLPSSRSRASRTPPPQVSEPTSYDELEGFSSCSPRPADWYPREEHGVALSTATIQSLDDFEASTSYQLSLSAMVKSYTEIYVNKPQPGLNEDEYRTWNHKDLYPDGDYDELQLYEVPDERTPCFNDRATTPFRYPSVDPLHYLPITPHPQNRKLFQAFMDVITKFVVSIDGNPSRNYYNEQWIPWSIKSPLLAQIGLFTAANYSAEVRKTPAAQSRLAIRHKIKSISMLNEILRSPDVVQSTCDEAVAAVVYFTTHEWYWGTTEAVHAHLSGLEDMVRLRGGLESTGMNPFLRQMIILCDYHIACSSEHEPRFRHPLATLEQYPLHLDSPLLESATNFIEHSAILAISTDTCVVLDDLRFLTASILHQNDTSPTSSNSEEIHLLSNWILSRLTALPTSPTYNTSISTDNIYKSCLIAATIFVRAINSRQPLSVACTTHDLTQLWGTMWRVTLTQWKQIPGVFIWILLVINPAAREMKYGRLVKSLLKSASFHVGLQNWDVVDGMLAGFVGVQRWLREGVVPGAVIDMNIM